MHLLMTSALVTRRPVREGAWVRTHPQKHTLEYYLTLNRSKAQTPTECRDLEDTVLAQRPAM